MLAKTEKTPVADVLDLAKTKSRSPLRKEGAALLTDDDVRGRDDGAYAVAYLEIETFGGFVCDRRRDVDAISFNVVVTAPL